MENSGSEIRSLRSGEKSEESSSKKSFFNLDSTLLTPSALKFFRFGLGFFVLYDLIQHFLDVSMLYTHDGLFPLGVALAKSYPWHHSVYFLSDLPSVVYSLYFVHMALAFLFMIGRGLPWVTILLWIFQFSLRNRSFIASDGGDDLSIILLFLSIFLPLHKPYRKNWSLLWSFVFTVQLLCVYFFSALKKTDPSWTSHFTATYLSLRLDHVSNSIGHFLLRFPNLLKFSTGFFYYLELIAPVIFFFCILFPQRTSIRIRKIICLLFIFFHSTLILSMTLWSFPFFCIIAWGTLYISLSDASSPKEEVDQKISWKDSLLPIPIFFLITILVWNLAEIDDDFVIPKPFHLTGQQLSLWQNWGMFAPYPMVNNQHVRIIGTDSKGIEHDLFNEKDWEQNRHRVKVLLNFNTMEKEYLESITQYYCRKNPFLIDVRIDTKNEIMNKINFSVEHTAYTAWKLECAQSK